MKKILDAGCGRGEFAIGTLSKKGYVFGVDFSEKFISNAKREAEKRGIKNCHFIVSALEKLPFKDDEFNEIHCYNVLEHVDDEKKSICELKRVLKKNGRIYISVPHKKSESFLKRLDKKYFSENMHKRIFDHKYLVQYLIKNDFTVLKHKNRGFFRAVGRTLRFFLKLPFEEQSGIVYKKNIFVSSVSYIDFLINSNFKTIRMDLNDKNKVYLAFPFYFLKIILTPIDFLMNFVYPAEFYIVLSKR